MTRLPIHAWCAVAMICLGPGVGGAAGPAGTVDISKLKKGDKLEVQVGREWVSAEYIETISDQMVRVKRADVPQPVGAIVAFIRLPKGRAKAKSQPKQADNPFATEEEKAAVGGLRTWTDRDGKFTVEARLLRFEDDKVVLRRADDKEIAVALDKLTEADQKYAADFKAGKVDVDAQDQSGGKDQGDTTEPAIPITPTNLNRARLIEIAAGAAWKYEPDPAPRGDVLRGERVALEPTEFFEKSKGLIFLPGEKKAFVVSVNSPPGFTAPVSRVQACDLSRGKAESGVFGEDVTPIDIAPDGSLVLAYSGKGWGFGLGPELRVYAREGNKVKPLAAWMPYNHYSRGTASSRADTGPRLDPEGDVTFTAFVDSKHVITMNRSGELALWEVPKLHPVYVVKCHHETIPARSGGGKYLALATGGGLAILNVLDGKVAGVIEAEMSGFYSSVLALRGDGQRLALRQHGRVRVWDLKSRELIRDFALDGAPSADLPTAWTDDDHLLVEGHSLVDVERRIAVWRYTSLGEAWRVRDGRLWFVGPGLGRNSLVLSSTALPQKGIPDPAPGMSAEQLLAIHPGMEVALELPANDPATMESVTNRLKQNGMTIVPQSKVRLVGTIQAGQSRTVEYRAFGALRRSTPLATTQATEQVLALSYVVDGVPVWKYETHTAPPIHLRTNKGESIDQAVQRSMQVDAKSFGHIWIPSHVARLPDENKTGVSPTPDG